MISLGPCMDIRLKMLSLILDFFSQLYYSHVKRKGNKVIHCLAKYVIIVSDLATWIKDVPPLFVFVLQADLASFSNQRSLIFP